MSTQKATPTVESVFEDVGIDPRTAFLVPVVTGVVVVLLGSLFLLAASPASGSLAFGVVASVMVGVVVCGFVGSAALLVASFVAPLVGGMPDPVAVLGR